MSNFKVGDRVKSKDDPVFICNQSAKKPFNGAVITNINLLENFTDLCTIKETDGTERVLAAEFILSDPLPLEDRIKNILSKFTQDVSYANLTIEYNTTGHDTPYWKLQFCVFEELKLLPHKSNSFCQCTMEGCLDLLEKYCADLSE